MDVPSTTRNSKEHSATRLRKAERAADDLMEDGLPGDFEELGKLRSTLDARYVELKAGRVQLIDGETACNTLKARAKSGATAREGPRPAGHDGDC